LQDVQGKNIAIPLFSEGIARNKPAQVEKILKGASQSLSLLRALQVQRSPFCCIPARTVATPLFGEGISRRYPPLIIREAFRVTIPLLI